MDLNTGNLVELDLDEIKPYWRNPRRISQEAVETLAESIRNYDYQQPIVVDSDHVIIVGHTRYSAMRKLGVMRAQVLVASHLTPKQVKEWRLIDNKSSEFGEWDFDKLAQEIEQLDSGAVEMFFPEFTSDDIDSLLEEGEQMERRMEAEALDPEEHQSGPAAKDVEFVCPSCFHMWEQPVTRDELLRGEIDPLADEQ